MYYFNLRKAVLDLKSNSVTSEVGVYHFMTTGALLFSMPAVISFFSAPNGVPLVYNDIYNVVLSMVTAGFYFYTFIFLYRKYSKKTNFITSFFVINFIATLIGFFVSFIFNLFYLPITNLVIDLGQLFFNLNKDNQVQIFHLLGSFSVAVTTFINLIWSAIVIKSINNIYK